MIKIVQNAPIQYDINLNFLINNKIWTGIAYRSASNLSALIGIQLNPQLLINYSYDYSLSKIQKYSQGSHEFTLAYLFAFKNRKIVTPRYF